MSDLIREISAMHETVKRLDKRIFGNGQPGIVQEITELKLKINNLEVSGKLIKGAIITFVTFIITNITLIAKVLN